MYSDWYNGRQTRSDSYVGSQERLRLWRFTLGPWQNVTRKPPRGRVLRQVEHLQVLRDGLLPTGEGVEIGEEPDGSCPRAFPFRGEPILPRVARRGWLQDTQHPVKFV